MAACWTSVVSVVDACCVTSFFTSVVFVFCVIVFDPGFVTTLGIFGVAFWVWFAFPLALGCDVGWLCRQLC